MASEILPDLRGRLLYFAATVRLKASSALAGAGALLLSFFSAEAPAGDLELSFLDVGYGDAILLKNPAGAFILIDTGYPEAREALSAELAKRGVTALDWLIVTHPHADHLGNAVWARKKFQPARWGDNGQAIDRFSQRLTEERAREYEKEFRGGTGYAKLGDGDEITWGETSLKVIWPAALASPDWNANSLVIALSCRNFSALLSGDINIPAERELVARVQGSLRASLLKTGHHGGADASGEEYLKAVSPRWAIVSVGANEWGNPSAETLRRIEAAEALVLRTDQEGTITVRYSPPDAVSIYSRRFGPLITSVR
jgi:competence protein ComEC